MNKSRRSLVVLLLVGSAWLPAAAAGVVWTDSGTDKIQRADLNGANVEDLILDDDPTGLALDAPAGKLYWVGSSGIRRAELDGSGVEQLVATADAEGLALHLDGGKMYWTEPGSNRIRRADLDGGDVETVIEATCWAVAVDPIAEKVYWTNVGSPTATDKIRRADLDGGAIEEILTGLVNPFGIALDLAGGKLYWTAVGPNKIFRADLDGANVEELLTGLVKPKGIALDLDAGMMYWVKGQEGIQRAGLDGSNPQQIVSGLVDPIGIALDLVGDDPAVPATSGWGTLAIFLAVGGAFAAGVLRRQAVHRR